MEVIISISPMLIIGLVFFIVIRKHIKEMNIKKEEYKKIPSVRVEFYDLLHLMRRGKKKTKSEFLAVYKDLSTNQLYVVGRKSFLASPGLGYAYIMGRPLNIIIRSHNQKKLEPQAKGDLHIATRLGNIVAESNMITIEGMRCEYKGNVQNLTSLNLKGQPEIRNLVQTNRIMEELNNATVIDGLIEFDIDKF